MKSFAGPDNLSCLTINIQTDDSCPTWFPRLRVNESMVKLLLSFKTTKQTSSHSLRVEVVTNTAAETLAVVRLLDPHFL